MNERKKKETMNACTLMTTCHVPDPKWYCGKEKIHKGQQFLAMRGSVCWGRQLCGQGGWRVVKSGVLGTSLVAQWLRIRLPMQGTRVRSLVQEDPTCRGTTKPVCHNYWACTLEPVSHNSWALVPQLLKPARLEPVLHNKRSHRSEKHAHRNKE